MLYVDTFAKKVFLKALKDKSGKSVLNATQSIFDQLLPPYHPPYQLITDGGKEFNNAPFKHYLKEQEVRLNIAVGEHKARFAERYIRSLKKILIPYLESNPSVDWEEAIANVMQAMNKRYNRSLGMSADEVPQQWRKVQRHYEEHDPYVPFDQYLAKQKEIKDGGKVRDGKEAFALGDKVFIPFKRAILDKESDRQYTYQEYTIIRIMTERQPYLYQLKDALGQTVKRLYYGKELRHASKLPDFFPISTIVKTRGQGKNKQFLVRWMDHDKRFDEWVSQSNIKSL